MAHELLIKLHAFRLALRVNPHMRSGYCEMNPAQNRLFFVPVGCERVGAEVRVAYPALCAECWFCGGAIRCHNVPFQWLHPQLWLIRLLYLLRLLT
jgi:hypothetical protein